MYTILLRRYFSGSLRATFKKILPWILYLFIIAFLLPTTISWIHRVAFFFYAVFVFSILYPRLQYHRIDNTDNTPLIRRVWIALLIFTGLFFIASRLIMFIRYGATPLGYDTGFYWQYFNQIMSYGTSQGYLGAGNIAYAAWFPYYFLDLSAISVISFLHIFHQFVTAGALYFLIRSFRPRSSSLPTVAATLFLFALSINQFMAFWWMFYKQSMALPFLIFATGLFVRRSWLAIPVAAFGAAIHLQSAIPFGVAFILFFLYQVNLCIIKKRPLDRELLTIGFSGLAVGLLILFLKSPKDILSYLEYFKQYGGFASNARDWEVQQAKGLFISFDTFRLNALFYLPFALTGILTVRSWLFPKTAGARLLIIPILLFVSLILASFPFLYQNRTLIILDIMLIIFAAYPITVFVKEFLSNRMGRLILALLGIGFILFTSRVIWNHLPQIYAEEAREIQATTQLRKPGDYAMTLTSLYTPWVYAYTNFQETIAPGWLSWNRWDINMWQEFWNGESDARRLELLRIYGEHDIYMFAGSYFTASPPLKKFLETDPHFKKISPHVWHYSPVPRTTLLPK